MESLRVTSSGARRFRLEGELCLGTVEILRDAIQPEAVEGDLTLELDELTFLDSSGLRELLEVLKRLQVTGSTLILHRPQGIVRKVLSLTKVDSRPDVRVTAESESPQTNDLPVA
ncbi:hypothetical protein BH20ACT24_BH20ACT24_08530 [soil metagenome]|nr:STAS domain-containing protein [Actinomycetota bacterium]